jgi:hypothetical protein
LGDPQVLERDRRDERQPDQRRDEGEDVLLGVVEGRRDDEAGAGDESRGGHGAGWGTAL